MYARLTAAGQEARRRAARWTRDVPTRCVTWSSGVPRRARRRGGCGCSCWCRRPPPTGASDAPGELAGYGPIPATSAANCCRPVHLHRPGHRRPDGHVIPEPASTPTPSAVPVRGAVAVGDREHPTCRFPGCNRRAVRCECDHIVPYNGHNTVIANLRTALSAASPLQARRRLGGHARCERCDLVDLPDHEAAVCANRAMSRLPPIRSRARGRSWVQEHRMTRSTSRGPRLTTRSALPFWRHQRGHPAVVIPPWFGGDSLALSNAADSRAPAAKSVTTVPMPAPVSQQCQHRSGYLTYVRTLRVGQVRR